MHKTNVLTHAGSLWSRVVEEVSLEHPDVAVDYQHVDATTIHMVTDPGRYDVIVTDNLFGDILTDLAAAVTGGIGLAASGNLDVSRANPSMFEPVHGSAPDIAGKGIADPTAAILSVALLLDHLGEPELARRVEAAVAFDLATRDHTQPGRHPRRRRPPRRPRLLGRRHPHPRVGRGEPCQRGGHAGVQRQEIHHDHESATVGLARRRGGAGVRDRGGGVLRRPRSHRGGTPDRTGLDRAFPFALAVLGLVVLGTMAWRSVRRAPGHPRGRP